MPKLTLNEYQQRAATTAHYPHSQGVVYTALGLAGEAGEVANKIKKWIRGDYKSMETSQFDTMREAVLDELGDSLWYLAMLASELGIDLEEVARRNINKLASRQERGVIQGNGDKR